MLSTNGMGLIICIRIPWCNTVLILRSVTGVMGASYAGLDHSEMCVAHDSNSSLTTVYHTIHAVHWLNAGELCLSNGYVIYLTVQLLTINKSKTHFNFFVQHLFHRFHQSKQPNIRYDSRAPEVKINILRSASYLLFIFINNGRKNNMAYTLVEYLCWEPLFLDSEQKYINSKPLDES